MAHDQIMTTLQKLQSLRDANVKKCFVHYATKQVENLFSDFDSNETKKFVSKMLKDTKDLSVCVTPCNTENKSYFEFARIPKDVDENGKVLTKQIIYGYSFEPKSFADVDKVISYYIDNYQAKLNNSIAFIREQREKENEKEIARAKKELAEKREKLVNMMLAYSIKGDMEKVSEIAKEIQALG